MRVLVVSSWLPYPLDNGSRMRAYHLLRELAQRHTLTLLSFGSLRDEGDLTPLRALCDAVEVVTPVPVDPSRLGWRGLLSPVPRHLVQNDNQAMRGLLARHIGGHDAAIGLQLDAARYLAAWTTIPRVFEEAEVAVPREQYQRESRPLRRARRAMTWWKFQRFLRDLVGRFEQTTVVSGQERAHLGAIGCDVARVAVVPNGIEVPDVDFPAARVRRLVYPGSVVYSANLDAVRFFVGEILPLVRRREPDVEFWVTGATEGADLAGLDAPGVCFTGPLPEVHSVIAQSAACVVPLRIGGGTRLKVLHAMALGTPVVSTSKGVEGLDVEADRHVRVGDTPAAFAGAILELLANPVQGGQMADRAKDVVRDRYSWRRIGDALEAALDHAVKRWGRSVGAGRAR